MAKNYTKKIVLGAAQFGLSYGVANKSGKISQNIVREILSCSKDSGVMNIDTASLYNNSELVIGRTIPSGNWRIITKTPVFKEDNIELAQVNYLRDSFKRSLVKMNQTNIEGLMIHNCEDLLKPGGWRLFKEMENLKSMGLIRKIGVSVYNSNQIINILKRYEIDIIQLPINILDQRLIKNGHLALLKKKGVEIYARSVFLQGLLLMNYEDIPAYFKPIKKTIKDLIIYSSDQSISRLTLLLGFVLGLKEVDYIVIGVDDLHQLKQIINSVSSIREFDIDDFKNFSIDDQNFINPSSWELKS